jgi:hypothetical protein
MGHGLTESGWNTAFGAQELAQASIDLDLGVV